MRGRVLAVLIVAVVTVSAGCARDTDAPADAIQAAVETASAEFAIEGMSCEGCVTAIGAALKATAGVVSQRVELAEARAHVTYDPTRTAPEMLIAVIEGAGYRAELVQPGIEADPDPTAL